MSSDYQADRPGASLSMENPKRIDIIYLLDSSAVLINWIMIIDLHVHTAISACSKLEISDILAHAKRFGLDGVCVTDHDVMDIRNHMDEGIQEDGLCVIFGMEYATPQGDFLIFGPYEEIPTGLEGRDLLNLVRETGGAAVAAHPFRPGRSADVRILDNTPDLIVESLNGRNPALADTVAKGLCLVRGFSQTGGSDAHSLDELGRAATRFEASVKSRNDLIRALLQGLCSPVSPPRQEALNSLNEKTFPFQTVFGAGS